jgi:pyruvate formate lyase activating enzyme
MLLPIKGLQKITLIDYPGKVAATIFLGGCNFRCSYCHNPQLVLSDSNLPDLSSEAILSFLKERQGFLDGICVTGGEPLLYPELKVFLAEVKALGFLVKVDTNGSFPKRLQELVEERLVDYVAMDIKAPKEKYKEVARTEIDLEKINESASYLLASDISYEFRTTVFSGLTLEDFISIGKWLEGAQRYYLQVGRTDVPLLDQGFAAEYRPPSKEYLEQVVNYLRPFFREVGIRN